MNTPTQATPEIRQNSAESSTTGATHTQPTQDTHWLGKTFTEANITTATLLANALFAEEIPEKLGSRFWRVVTDEFAPEIKRGEIVMLSANKEAEPQPGDVVATPAQNQHGFNLARFCLGCEVLAVIDAVLVGSRVRLDWQGRGHDLTGAGLSDGE